MAMLVLDHCRLFAGKRSWSRRVLLPGARTEPEHRFRLNAECRCAMISNCIAEDRMSYHVTAQPTRRRLLRLLSASPITIPNRAQNSASCNRCSR